MGERRYTVRASQVISLQTFFARQAMISNLLPSWLFVRIGGTDVPNQESADWSVPPMTAQIIPLPATNMLAVGVGPAIVTIGQQVAQGQGAIFTLYDEPTPVAVGSMDLNPSRMGQMHQEAFVAPTSYTLDFPATTVHVANYSTAWLYIGIGTLVAPTVATCSIAIPPMTEKALPCAPTTQFAFAFSAALVTVGDQVPAGMRVIVTFYEYPTPVAIGTADLQSSRMGQSTQRIFSVSSSYTIAFSATQVHVSNYSTSWVWVAYGTLVIPGMANAMASVAPMSERSLPCPPNTQFAFGLSAATVVAPTGMQQTNVVATFSEYATPIALGSAPLAPSGWLYRERLHNNVAVADGTILDRDLSNFIWGRYSVQPLGLPGARFLMVSIWDWSQATYATQAANLLFVQDYEHSITFHAGKPIRITYETSDLLPFTLKDFIEAW